MYARKVKLKWGQIVVGTSVLLLGLGHFGKDSGLMNMSVAGVSVGTVAGVVGVGVGACILINRFYVNRK